MKRLVVNGLYQYDNHLTPGVSAQNRNRAGGSPEMGGLREMRPRRPRPTGNLPSKSMTVGGVSATLRHPALQVGASRGHTLVSRWCRRQ